MDKTYNHKIYEEKIYEMWEKSGAFTPPTPLKLRGTSYKPFTIILPLPNANDPMHMGHALFTVEDIMIRYHRMKGDPTLWLPGGDHAGIETQYVFEKHLKEQGKSRFDFDRETLYKMIWDFAQTNKDLNKDQMKRLGFSMDWTRYHYSLEPEIINQVLETFRKLHKDGLVYRGQKIVNYCTRCGTAFSDLEVIYKERDDFLYFLDYGIIQVATTRPETIFADTAIAVNPSDNKYKSIIGKKAIIPLINLEIPIITDKLIDKSFGTGALKVTPAHDATDYEIGIRHNLQIISCISTSGQMESTDRVPKPLWGLYINKAREETIRLLESKGKLIKKEPLTHSVGTCYRCGSIIEPLVVPQWYVKTKRLAQPAIDAVKKGETKIFPKKRFEKLYFDWMDNIHDWNISRQIVWGPRIPIWYCLDCNSNIQINFINKSGQLINDLYSKLINKNSLGEIKKGLQSLHIPVDCTYQLTDKNCEKCKGSNLIQETDTFDTWFLSGQWPLTTLGFNVGNPKNSSPDFEYFYPTSVLDTLWDILFFWVGRMMMFGLYLTGKVPFKVVHLHARVVDKLGRKMSKSKGNVINPIEMVNKYGADALRLALVMGVAPASDISLSDEKVLGSRNFANKLWNIARFTQGKLESAGIKKFEDLPPFKKLSTKLTKSDKDIIKKLNEIIEKTTKNIEEYRFGNASENLYQFIWHEYADIYIESVKERLDKNDLIPLIVLRHVLFNSLKLLHPFMPFVTEAIWSEIKTLRKYPNDMLITSRWPEATKTSES